MLTISRSIAGAELRAVSERIQCKEEPVRNGGQLRIKLTTLSSSFSGENNRSTAAFCAECSVSSKDLAFTVCIVDTRADVLYSSYVYRGLCKYIPLLGLNLLSGVLLQQ